MRTATKTPAEASVLRAAVRFVNAPTWDFKAWASMVRAVERLKAEKRKRAGRGKR